MLEILVMMLMMLEKRTKTDLGGPGRDVEPSWKQERIVSLKKTKIVKKYCKRTRSMLVAYK